MADRRRLHAEALSDADGIVHALLPTDLARASECAGWSVRALVGHMIGQNVGFAQAIRLGDAPEESYAPRPVDGWAASVAELHAAVQRPQPMVRLAEVAPERQLPLEAVLGIHALDLAAHAWDIDRSYRPGEDLVQLVLTVARSIPPRQATGGPFAPAIAEVRSPDPWQHALALLGRA